MFNILADKTLDNGRLYQRLPQALLDLLSDFMLKYVNETPLANWQGEKSEKETFQWHSGRFFELFLDLLIYAAGDWLLVVVVVDIEF